MKLHADRHCHPFEFEEGDWVWLKLQSYRQNSANPSECVKLAKRFYGLFRIEAKISTVAYRLKLPSGSTIHLVFHIALLKPFQGNRPQELVYLLPPLATESHLILYPTNLVAYRRIQRKRKAITQVLVEWLGLPPEQRMWEDISTIQRLTDLENLEDNFVSDECGDVTIQLELDIVVQRL